MKPGDLVAWNSFAEACSGFPMVGEYCGLLLKIVPQIHRSPGQIRPSRVEVLDNDGEILITRKAYVNVIE